MKNALKRLQGRLRARWHLLQARTAIARCNRSVARRARIGVPVQPLRRPRGPYFAPGIIDAPPARGVGRRGMRLYFATLAIAAVGLFGWLLGGAA